MLKCKFLSIAQDVEMLNCAICLERRSRKMYTYGRGNCTLRMTMRLSNGDIEVSNSLNITFDEDDYAVRTAASFSKNSFEALKNSLDKRMIAKIRWQKLPVWFNQAGSFLEIYGEGPCFSIYYRLKLAMET